MNVDKIGCQILNYFCSMRKTVQLFFANCILISVMFTLVMQPLHELEHHAHHHDSSTHQQRQTSQRSASITEKCPICDFQLFVSNAHQPFDFEVELCVCNRIEPSLILNSYFTNSFSNVQLRAPPIL